MQNAGNSRPSWMPLTITAMLDCIVPVSLEDRSRCRRSNEQRQTNLHSPLRTNFPSYILSFVRKQHVGNSSVGERTSEITCERTKLPTTSRYILVRSWREPVEMLNKCGRPSRRCQSHQPQPRSERHAPTYPIAVLYPNRRFPRHCNAPKNWGRIRHVKSAKADACERKSLSRKRFSIVEHRPVTPEVAGSSPVIIATHPKTRLQV
jgi:hypothetical protein